MTCKGLHHKRSTICGSEPTYPACTEVHPNVLPGQGLETKRLLSGVDKPRRAQDLRRVCLTTSVSEQH
eukprot:37143-Eustigmatos_ZCMA.PRE.1